MILICCSITDAHINKSYAHILAEVTTKPAFHEKNCVTHCPPALLEPDEVWVTWMVDSNIPVAVLCKIPDVDGSRRSDLIKQAKTHLYGDQ